MENTVDTEINRIAPSTHFNPTLFYVYPEQTSSDRDGSISGASYKVIEFGPNQGQNSQVQQEKEVKNFIPVKNGKQTRLEKAYSAVQFAMGVVGLIGLLVVTVLFICNHDPIYFALLIHFTFATEIGVLSYFCARYKNSTSYLTMVIINLLFLPIAGMIEIVSYKIPIISLLCLMQAFIYSKKFVMKQK